MANIGKPERTRQVPAPFPVPDTVPSEPITPAEPVTIPAEPEKVPA